MTNFTKLYARNGTEVSDCIVRFNGDVQKLASYPVPVQHDTREFSRRSRAVYAVKVGDDYLACGGKLCAHVGLDIETYSRVRSKLNGGHAHAHIRQFADPVGRDHPAHKAWERLCASLGLQPMSAFETFLVRENGLHETAPIPPLEAKLVDLIVHVSAILSPSSRANLKQRVAAISV